MLSKLSMFIGFYQKYYQFNFLSAVPCRSESNICEKEVKGNFNITQMESASSAHT